MRLSIAIMNTAIQQARYVQSGFLIPTFSIPGPAQMVPAGSGAALVRHWNRRVRGRPEGRPPADRRSLADDQVREARGRLAGYRRRGSGAAATAATTTAATATAAAITGGDGDGRAGVVERSLYDVPIGRGDARGRVDGILARLARRAVMSRGESRVVFDVRVGQGIVRVD